MASRRWLWGLAGAAVALWLARAVRAQVPAAPADGVRAPPVGEAPPASGARPVRRAAAGGYAAEAVRTLTPLPPHEREARYWLRMAALAAQVESEASRLAATRAESPAVRTLAAELLEQHESGRLELMHLLHAREMAPPLMDTAQRKALQRLARATGRGFDRQFVELVGSASRRDEWLQFGRAAPALGDPLLQAWVERQLPGLRRQHAAAERLLAASSPPHRRSVSTVPADRSSGARQP
ncbi:DUF4142 domain-containing protein [Ramlibacter tataouinensis]|uniref:DUF4142 domain-containing protein n=1 Tax=Ramlibacter tataouinensis TaxID=94132 RepID=UPI0022F3DE75|nr:DUF4142 domain-containing protein [Ramlibacter tataouinensis]WBY02584.1 DUF4142 domain-containing protein [Ramlibacter tataouinensis]